MRRIDLTCLILAPMVVGFLLTYVSMPVTLVVVAAWNMSVWLPECCLLALAQAKAPMLRYGKLL